MSRFLSLLAQPGVLRAGLIGTLLQVALGFANSQNIGGIADTIGRYGLSGQLTSGGLVAALTGLFYAVTTRTTGQTIATGAGAAAGGISGALGTSLSQALSIVPVAAGAMPLINFSAVGASLLSLAHLSGTAASATGDPMFDTVALAQVFGSTAAGGGIGAWLGRSVSGRRSPA